MNGDICRKMGCSLCCNDTEMELTNSDIERIGSLGFTDFFRIDEYGSRILRNIEGHCFFLDGENCIIYENKPKGCDIYPVIMSIPSMRPMMDRDCPHRHLFRFDPEEIQQLEKLVREVEEGM